MEWNGIKDVFGYTKYHSVTDISLDFKLPSFDVIMQNNQHVLSIQSSECENKITM